MTVQKMAFYKNKNAFYVKISTVTELCEKWCPFGPHNYKTKAKSDIWFNFYGCFCTYVKFTFSAHPTVHDTDYMVEQT